MSRVPPKLDGLRRRERAEAVVKHQSENEMPIGLRMISLAKNGMIYGENQIRQFAKYLAYEMAQGNYPENIYRIDFAHRGGNNYEIIASNVPDHEELPFTKVTPEIAFRRLWEGHATLEDAWMWFRKEFGDEAVRTAIDRAMERQAMREAGEIE